jgi:hypothetical protein
MCHVREICRCSGSAGIDQSILDPTGPIHFCPTRVDTLASTCVIRALNESAHESFRSSEKLGTHTHTHTHAHTHTHSPHRKLCDPRQKKGRCALSMPALRPYVEGQATYKNIFAYCDCTIWCSLLGSRNVPNTEAPATAEGNSAGIYIVTAIAPSGAHSWGPCS